MQLTYNNQSLLATGCYEKNDSGVTNFGKEAIKEIRKTIEKKAPKVIVVIDGGNVSAILGDSPIDAHVIDYDVEGQYPDDCHEIPQGEGKTTTAVPYIGDIFEENADRVNELLTAINR